jgi:formiminotetrahydrofolate cyclodeaminase
VVAKRLLTIQSETVESLLARFADGTPTPGGGAAAALTAATAAALLGMVCRVTQARSGTDPRVTATAARADELRPRLLGLVAADASAYERVLEGRRLSGDARPLALRRALVGATEVPLEVARHSLEILTASAEVAGTVRASALGDLGVLVSLAWAALESSAGTARMNLKVLEDAAFVTTAERELARLVAEGTSARARAAEMMAARA